MSIDIEQRKAASRIINELRRNIGALQCQIDHVQRQTVEGRFDRAAERRTSRFVARLYRTRRT